MSVTISINGLSLVHEGSRGVSMATLPDVCLTPPAGVPVPYSNVAFSRDLAGGTRSVRVDGGSSAATARAVFAKSAGDEAGRRGGIVSGVHRGEASFLTYSPNVRLEGRPACRLTDKMLHNHGNTLNACGECQDNAKAKGKRSKHEVGRLLVEVVDATTKKPVHAPVRVVLKAKDDKRSSTSRNEKDQIVFRHVKKKMYRVIAIHSCYPQGYEKVRVKKNKQVVRIELVRAKLRDAADKRKVRLGVNGVSSPESWDVATAEFHDVVSGTFWSSLQQYIPGTFPPPEAGKTPPQPGEPPPPRIPDWVRHKLAEASKRKIGVEATPLFWAAPAVASAKKGEAWRPNPYWVTAITKPEEALSAVLTFITDLVSKYKQEPSVLGAITRCVVINEPMNALMRNTTRKHPFIKALLPTTRDKQYARDEVRAIKEANKRQRRKRPIPGIYKLESAAINNLVAIIEHAHALLPGVLLIVNDYGIDGYDGKEGLLGMRGYRFVDMMRKIIKVLQERNNTSAITMLRVGFQAHLRSGGQLDSAAAREPLDFRPSAIRSQVKRLKAIKLKICVTEADLELPALTRRGKYKNLAEEHVDKATVVVGKERVLREAYKMDPGMYYNKAPRPRLYLRAFARQRSLSRDAIASILWSGNVESFVWWDLEDGLPHKYLGSNFRYHGYLYHRYLVCTRCKNDPEMQVKSGPGVLYRKPKYWGAVSAFQNPRKVVLG